MNILDFLNTSHSQYQAVQYLENAFIKAGAEELKENELWTLEYGKSYFVKRNGSSLIAFCIPKGFKGFRVFASHSDSPTYKIKENPEITVEDHYVKLNTEGYGGMISSTFLDRPLSVAGRVVYSKDGETVSKNIDIDRDLMLIPNLAIHMNREINSGFAYNPQTDMLPLFGGINAKGEFMKLVAEEAGINEEDILGHDLYLYVREKAKVWGYEDGFISSPKLDDLECAYAGAEGFIDGEKKDYACINVLFDNEEVGSGTRQGAASTLLKDTLLRIKEGFEISESDFQRFISGSFLLSADNGHAVHPNHPEKADPTNRPYLNEGILLKYNSNQKYATDGYSAALFKQLAKKAGVKYQIYFNRSDIAGGGTLGHISLSQVPFATADIGLPELSMHSSFETAGIKDIEYLKTLSKVFFE